MKKGAALSIPVAVMLLAVAVMAQAQQQTKLAKIGVLSSGSRSASGPGTRLDLIRQGVHELGYVVG